MKKIVLVPVCLVAMAIAANAQNQEEKKTQEPKPSLEAKKFAPPKIVSATDAEFLTRNPDVNSVRFKGGNIVIITGKDKKVEKFDLSDDKQNKAFVAKYGQPPVAPPPPPPAPPAPPRVSNDQKVKKTN